MTSDLPPIDGPLTIDGYSQGGPTNTVILIQLNLNGHNGLVFNSVGGITGASTVKGLSIFGGSGAGIAINTNNVRVAGNFLGVQADGTTKSSNASGVLITGSNNTISGANIIGANGTGIDITGSGAFGNLVVGNFIGTDASGAKLGNGTGVVIENSASGNTIGGTGAGAGNVISGNSGDGIDISSDGNLVQGNLIGTNAAGTAALGNGGNGVVIDNGASNNTIGAGNVISGNSSDGIDIGSFFPTLSSGNDNLVQGNKIGTNAAGTAELSNGSAGVRFVDGMSNTVKNNVISGNVNEGIFFHGNDGASDEMVLGNWVGTNFDGTAEIPNGLDGISLLQSAGNTIRGNVISGNGNPSRTAPMSRNGIKLAGADDNLIQANLIGTDASGTRALPNISDGVFVSGSNNDGVFVSSSNNTIGGTTDNDRNVISGNGNDGVEMISGASNNAVLGNFIGMGADGTTAWAMCSMASA